ncbi:ATP-binding protein [Kitasatospora acidiphila]|uniref:ATP-binding protein n=1 Tax=Kitasatospora acidiphila TaxID=2567942 RepID=A0A540VZI0_9ACTN|nr:ATP-binding protein [Kitasatospora acidiphila]TQF02158.1 ATP-binding protein [Kitasatospora acidiphila]
MHLHSNRFLLLRAPFAVPTGRARVSRLLRLWRVRTDEDSRLAVETVASELLTNAVEHGAGLLITVGVYVNRPARSLLIDVYDASPVQPVPRLAGSEDENGRGLLLVSHLAVAHGTEPTDRGKKVWAECALPDQEPPLCQSVIRSRHALNAPGRQDASATIGGALPPPSAAI